MEKKIIMYDSPEAATYKTGIEGWVSSEGIFWGKDEHMARWGGCTHMKCKDCGHVHEKTWIRCENCRQKTNREAYMKFPFKEYSGEPVTEYSGDKYFFNEEDIVEYMEENEMTELDLLFCEENHYHQLSYDYWEDHAYEDWEPPKKLIEAVDALNKVIEGMPPQSYSPGKIRTTYKLNHNP